MKKIFKLFLVLGLFVTTGLGFVACNGKPKVKEIYVDLGEQTSISVKHKSNWNPAEELDVKGILSNGDEIDIDEDDCSFEGVDVNVADEQVLTISYGAYETEVTVNVYEYVSQIAIQAGTIATEVDYNGTLDISQAKLVVKYSNDTTVVLNRNQFEISEPVTNVHGEQSLTVSYAEKEIQFPYTVNKIVSEVQIIGSYDRSVLWGSTYNYDGVMATILYSDGSVDPETKLRADLTLEDELNTETTITEGTSVKSYFTMSYAGVEGRSADIDVYIQATGLEYVNGFENYYNQTAGRYEIEAGTALAGDVVNVNMVYNNGLKKPTTINVSALTLDTTILGTEVTEVAKTLTLSKTLAGFNGNETKQVELTFIVMNLFKGIYATESTEYSKYVLNSNKVFNASNFEYFEDWSINDRKIDLNSQNLDFSNEILGNETDGYYVVATYNYKGSDYTTNINLVLIDTWDEVTDPQVTVTGIEILSGLPTEVKYNEELNINSLRVRVTYSNGKTQNLSYVDYSSEMDVEFNKAELGNQPFKLTYEGQEATATIAVKRALVEIRVKDGTEVEEVKHGTANALANVVIEVVYEDGVVELTAGDYTQTNLTYPTANDYLTAGAHEITRTITYTFVCDDCYGGQTTKTCSMYVVVYEEAESIALNNSYQLLVLEEDQEFDKTKHTYYLVYTSGNRETLDVSALEFDIPTITEAGNYEVTVSKGALETTINVTAVNTWSDAEGVSVSSIEILSGLPTEVKYNEELNLNNLQIRVTYSNGQESVLAYSAYSSDMDVEFNKAELGNQPFKLTYEGQEATATIAVKRALVEIRVKDGTEVEEVKHGTANALANVVIEVVYEDGVVELTAGDYTQTNLTYPTANDYLTAGAHEITRTITYTFVCDDCYGGQTTKTCSMDVVVYEEAEELVVDPTTKVLVLKANQSFNKADHDYYLVYTSENRETLDVSALEFDIPTITEAGNYEVTVSNGTFDATIETEAVDTWADVDGVTVSSIEITSTLPDLIAHNEVVNYQDMQIKVNYSNGATLTLAYSDYTADMVVTFNSSVVGNQTFKLAYKGQEATKTIVVKRIFQGLSVKTSLDRALWGSEDFSGVVLLATYSDGTEDVVYGDYRIAEFTRPTANEYKTEGVHELTKQVTFEYTCEDCYNGPVVKSCTMNIAIYEEMIALTQEGAIISVDYNTTEKYADMNTIMKVYFAYTSGNLVEVSAFVEGEGGYTTTIIDLAIPGKQPLYIQYYVVESSEYDEENEKWNYTYSNTHTTIVYVMVNDPVTNYEITGVKTTVTVGSTVDYSSLALVPTFASGATVTLGDYVFLHEGEYTPINTATAGEKTLVVNYGGKTYELIILVTEDAANYTFLSFEKPDFVAAYEKNSANKNTYTSTENGGNKGFNVTGNQYVVGNDNPFKFSPIYKVKYSEGSTFAGILEQYNLNAEVRILGEATALVAGANDYYTFNGTTHEFTFTDAAIGLEFEIKVWPDQGNKTDAGKFVSFDFKVIDGYNVYDATSFSVLDNANVSNKWEEYKLAHNIPLDLDVNGVVLHNNITITKDDIPERHFYTASEVNKSDLDYDMVVGSLKDIWGNDLTYIYSRKVNDGEEFTLEGNYFTVDYSKMPLMVRELGKVNSDGSAITTHTAIFAIWGPQGLNNIITEESSEKAYVNNVSWFGNAKKSENTALSGGILGIKSMFVSVDIYNNISNAVYIPYFFQGTHEGCENKVMALTQTNGFDAYNTMIYMNGVEKLLIDGCNLIGAGGPIMICDHVGDDYEKDPTAGYETNVYVDTRIESLGISAKSVLESWVAGTEGWFQTYSGSGALASGLKALDPLLATYKKSMLRNDMLNLIAVYKSSSAEGLTSRTIRGTFKVHGYNPMNLENVLAMKAQAQQKLTTVLEQQGLSGEDLQKTVIDTLGKIAILETYNLESEENGIGVPLGQTEMPWLIAPSELTEQGVATSQFLKGIEYMNVYLFNGMAAVLGLSQSYVTR